MGSSGPEFVIAALVPMTAWPVRIKADNFFPLDIDAEGGAPHFALQAPQGPEIQGEVTCLGQRPNQYPAHIGLAIDHRRHRKPSSVIGRTRMFQPYIPTATLREHTLLTQGFMSTLKAAFPRRLRPQNRDSVWANLVNALK